METYPGLIGVLEALDKFVPIGEASCRNHDESGLAPRTPRVFRHNTDHSVHYSILSAIARGQLRRHHQSLFFDTDRNLMVRPYAARQLLHFEPDPLVVISPNFQIKINPECRGGVDLGDDYVRLTGIILMDLAFPSPFVDYPKSTMRVVTLLPTRE